MSVLWQPEQLQSMQARPCAKHSQYSFRHLLFLQLHWRDDDCSGASSSLAAAEAELDVLRKRDDSWLEDRVGRPMGMAALDVDDREVDESSGEDEDEDDADDRVSDGWMGELFSEDDEDADEV